MENTSTPTVYSLSLEELALALGLINRPDLGRVVLSSIYPNLSESESEARLSSASHSLLARGICSLNEKNNPILDSELEKALLPLAKFDYLLQLSIVMDDGQVNITVHVRRKQTFTSRLIQAGVVNMLTHGQTSSLADYFLNIFDGIGLNGSANAIQAKITLDTIGKIVSKNSSLSDRARLLTDIGWAKEDAKMLSEDLEEQKVRATIIRIDASDQSLIDNSKITVHKNLLLLKGKTRSWAFLFENTKDEAAGKTFLLDRKRFEEILVNFIS